MWFEGRLEKSVDNPTQKDLCSPWKKKKKKENPNVLSDLLARADVERGQGRYGREQKGRARARRAFQVPRCCR